MQLTQTQLIKACCRAMNLWGLGDDAVDAGFRESDKELLKCFGGAWNDYKNKSTPINYTQHQVEILIRNCQVRKSQIGNKNIPKISTYLMQPTYYPPLVRDKFYSVLARRNHAFAIPKKPNARWEYAREFTKELALELDVRRGSITKVTAPRVSGGIQRAFASRVLFFALPEMHAYNYSLPLINKLKSNFKLQADTVDAVFEKMNELFLCNEQELRKLQRPNFDDLDGLETSINAGDWWERRVLDLAILENW